MKIYFLLCCIILVTFGELCPNGKAYQCTDIVDSTKCSGVLSGRSCVWKVDKCLYQTCEDLGGSCLNTILEGKQCFKNKNSLCVGADSCLSYDSQETCKSFKNMKCTWDTSDENNNYCRTASCVDITAPEECMKSIIGSTECYYWGNLNQCDVAICENRSEDQCNGKYSNGKKCIWRQTCREMTCEDQKVKNQVAVTDGSTQDPNVAPNLEECQTDNFSLSSEGDVSCINQLNLAQIKTCTQVSSCSDYKSENICINHKIPSLECKWDISCRMKSCRDFQDISSCPKEYAESGCTWDTKLKTCISCGEISNGCTCNEQVNCIWNYDQLRNQSSCVVKKCSIFGTQIECQNQNCYWNSETILCGNSADETGYTQTQVQDKNSQGATGNANKESISNILPIMISLINFILN